jgi:hypothetical protein
MKKAFDIHLAADVMSSDLGARLESYGFVRDAFIGGTPGVVHPCHYSCHPTNRSLQEQLWERVTALLRESGPSEFHGYAEAEVTPPNRRVDLPGKVFDPLIPFPFGRLEYEDCPIGRHKDFDIHVTADLTSIDTRLKHVFEDDVNFNYVDIEKQSGRVVRVYTFQPLGTNVTHEVFDMLLGYLRCAGGLEGKIKLEVCTHFERFPETAACCPIIRELPARRL